MLTDPIADFLNRIRNASHARRRELTVPASRAKLAIAHVLVSKKLIESVSEETANDTTKELIVVLRTDREPLEVKRVSKPGQRIYVGYKDIKRVRNGLGIGIISTSAGVMPSDEARQKKLGGEYIGEVY